MNAGEADSAFAAFREALFDDMHLLLRIRPAREREAYVAHVVRVGVERGFVFDADAVRAAMREGEDNWLMTGASAEQADPL